MRESSVAPLPSTRRLRPRWASPSIGAIGLIVRLIDLGVVVLSAPAALSLTGARVDAARIRGGLRGAHAARPVPRGRALPSPSARLHPWAARARGAGLGGDSAPADAARPSARRRLRRAAAE